MDVIEGRGVNAFVRDPDAFERVSLSFDQKSLVD